MNNEPAKIRRWLRIALVGLAGYLLLSAYLPGLDPNICFKDPIEGDVLQAPRAPRASRAVENGPLTLANSTIGYLIPDELVNVEAICETAAGTDLKVKSQSSGLEGYVPARLLDAWPSPGTELALRSDAPIFDTLAKDAVSKNSLPKDTLLMVLEGPRFVGQYGEYRVQILHSPNRTGWISIGALALADVVKAPDMAPYPPPEKHPFLRTLIVVLLGLPAGLWMVARMFPDPQAEERYEQAEYGIPHTEFARTTDGFTATFTTFRWHHRLMLSFSGVAIVLGAVPLSIATFFFTSGLVGEVNAVILALIVFASVLWVFWWVWNRRSSPTTTVKVTNDAVIIDEKMLRRRDFGGFHIAAKLRDKGAELGVLGYTYGMKNFVFGGQLVEPLATEIIAGLNRELRLTPVAGDEKQVSTEQLRNARSTEF